jgi:hypothetical protein
MLWSSVRALQRLELNETIDSGGGITVVQLLLRTLESSLFSGCSSIVSFQNLKNQLNYIENKDEVVKGQENEI